MKKADRNFRYSLFTLLILFILSAVDTTSANTVVAKVNAEEITLEEFNEQYQKVLEDTMNPPSKEAFLEDLIRFEVGAQEAARRKVMNDPVVKEEIRKLMYRWLVEKAIGDQVAKIKVTERDMKRYYATNPELRTSHILIQVKPGANKKERAIAVKRAREIYAEVRKGKRPFDEMVKLYTDDVPTKNTGGDLGWQSRVTLTPSYYEAALKTRVGQLAPLIETKYGFHIIKVTGRRSYDDANKRQIRFAVFENKRKRLFDRYFAKLKQKYKIQKNLSAINK